MKVSINSKFLTGPYGGGMQFANYLKKFLSKNGVKVINHLKANDIEIILHVNPFPFLTSRVSAYSFLDAYAYKLSHPKVKIIQRINECDQRKGTHYMNKLLVKSTSYADYIVFVGSWLKPLLEKSGLDKNKPSQTILSGADKKIFNTKDKIFWNGKNKVRLVTHHWGPNYLKGHDVYQKLDQLLEKPAFKAKFEFTYIGQYPKNLRYKNTNIIKPIAKEELAKELKTHDLYITASRNEPGSMHNIEGALCGLPILYINSGALPEYCSNYGIEFNLENLEEKIYELRKNYNLFKGKILTYPYTAEKMANQYYELFKRITTDSSGEENIFKSKIYIIYSALYSLFWNTRKRVL